MRSTVVLCDVVAWGRDDGPGNLVECVEGRRTRLTLTLPLGGISSAAQSVTADMIVMPAAIDRGAHHRCGDDCGDLAASF